MAQISIDNGNSLISAHDAISEIMDRGLWDVVANMMDDGLREEVCRMPLDYNDDETHDNELFLAAYLELCTDDFIAC